MREEREVRVRPAAHRRRLYGATGPRFAETWRAASDGLVERSEILLSSKDDIRGVFDLHQAPVVRHAELASDRIIAPGEPVEGAMQLPQSPRARTEKLSAILWAAEKSSTCTNALSSNR